MNMRKYNGKPEKQSAASPGSHWGIKRDRRRKEREKKQNQE